MKIKKSLICLLLIASLTACTSSTYYGECIGIADDKLPDRNYKVSGWNIAMAMSGL